MFTKRNLLQHGIDHNVKKKYKGPFCAPLKLRVIFSYLKQKTVVVTFIFCSNMGVVIASVV
jgi:hypothetical protein